MPETYGAHECRAYFVQETVYGQTPTNPAMLGINSEDIEPALDPNLIQLRGIGSRDLQALKQGLRNPTLKILHVPPSEAPTSLIQHAQTLNSLSIQLLYYKGLFASATDILSLLYKGCRIHKLSVECSIEDIIKANVELIGQTAETGTAKIAGATYADYASAVAYNESYIQKGEGDGSGLTALDRVTDWKFTIENNLKPVPVIRSTDGHLLKYLPARHRGLTGELTFEFESKQEFDDVISDSEFSLKFGLGGTNSALFKYCKWEKVATPTRIEDLVALKASFVSRDVYIS
ncbi:MAG: phage tail tube protein [Candidatus Bathyarchaeota archaeon]|nr:phage tail tube protein [Candidatus Bathyarchaeota archaeon]